MKTWIETGKEHPTITAEQLMWQQRDQELAISRERERANKEKERQRREREGIWSAVGGLGLSDHVELDKESYSYVQFARDGNARRPAGHALENTLAHVPALLKQVGSRRPAAASASACTRSTRCTSTATR